MTLDPDTLRLAEAMLAYAKEMRYGQLKVRVSLEYLVDVHNGKLTASAVQLPTFEVLPLPRVTAEQLRKAESVIT